MFSFTGSVLQLINYNVVFRRSLPLTCWKMIVLVNCSRTLTLNWTKTVSISIRFPNVCVSTRKHMVTAKIIVKTSLTMIRFVVHN